MARPKATIPAYSLHKPSGQACVYLNRQRKYLGPYGSPESRKRYAEILDSLATGEPEPTAAATPEKTATLTLNELFLKFVQKEIGRYSAGEAYAMKAAMKVCRQLYGETLVSEFGPVRFRTMRDAMVAGDPATGRKPWCRKTANRQAKRIRQILRWGNSWELVPLEVVQNLDSVRALAIGETEAIDYAPRLAVPEADIEAVRQQLQKHHRDLFDLLILTGARPGELLKVTGRMLQRRPDVWLAELSDHKTSRKGKRRFLVFNKSAQAILLRNTKPGPDAPLFSQRRDNFTTAVNRACKRAGITPFCPHQLRHTTAARLVDEVGLEAAQAVLGHSEIAMTLHYSRSAEKQATEAVQRLG